MRIDSENLKASEIKKKLKGVSGILIPGGFGKRGTEGKKLRQLSMLEKKKIPFFWNLFLECKWLLLSLQGIS